jgi:hypothetical protein
VQNVTYSMQLKQAPDLYAKAQQATALLEDILKASAGRVTAEWDRIQDDQGLPAVSLRLADSTGARSAALAAWELEQRGQLRFRLYRIWDDLLRVRAEKQLEKLMEPASPGE